MNLTEEQIKESIKTSRLREEDKQAFIEAVPLLLKEEVEELMKLIKDSNAAAKKFEEEKEEALGKLNEEYDEKLKTVTRDESKYLRKEIENFDREQETAVMEDLDLQLNS